MIFNIPTRQKFKPGRINQAIILVLLCLAIPASLAASPANQTLKQGVFLVASDHLAGSSFEKTVILVTKYSKYGAFGVVINRPSRFTIQDVFPTIKSARIHDKVFLGGPVHASSFVYLMNKSDSKNTLPVIEGIHLGGGQKNLIPVLEKAQSNDVIRAYAGYAGWAPGQLDAELARGDWLIAEADKASIFENNNNLWNQLTQILKGKWI